ncbi:NAD(P)/FAD-dependent oxidoreductase [Shewanella sedimentimangrovi]|uniref:FAD-dependent oxidoreductase n=1 Tax=Shewanella sedimentimangrovi TaxID=2814293 RepID=A0ABX7R0S0_9GAMM|nr:FAD-dependent oxidoreductase [Shewanella sedimentimangrovi]QSX36675.1 FAD-dependent oxidoreductase [Shewanella sedimentimangrovi]
MKKIAIIGSGISGLTAGHLLHRHHAVTLFEAAPSLGGHTATVDVTLDGRTYAIDTGFIVFNDRTYPRFQRLLARTGLGAQPTEMSFSVSTPEGFEYNGHNLDTLFAQRRNLLRPRFWNFIREILRFNRLGKEALAQGDAFGLTLGDFLLREGFSEHFARHYILPMGAAIWSSTLADMRAFPLGFFLRFFAHHGLLEMANRPQWYVIPGGSREYIAPLTQGWESGIRLATPVLGVSRNGDGVVVRSKVGDEAFDEVIFACHSDQALALLDDASEAEREVLGAMTYQANEVWLHTDTRLLPRRRKAWASWNYRLNGDDASLPLVTYNMNILQGIEAPHTFCVTLNPGDAVDERCVLRRFVYDHPVFNQASLAAQGRRDEICGTGHTHFCGAYWYNGFHEDGVRSALDVVERLGGRL